MSLSFPSSSNYVYEFKATVHLNNVGVTLLERGYCQQAMQVFGYAISIMKAVSSRANHHQHQQVQASFLRSDDIQAKLKVAANHLAQAVPRPSSVGNNVSLQVISDHENPVDFLRQGAGVAVTPSTVVHPLRMEPFDFEAPNETDVAIECSILLYNYSVAYVLSLLFSNTNALKADAQQRLKAAALHMSNLAYTSLSSHYQNNESLEHCTNNRILLVSLLVLRQLANLTRLESCKIGGDAQQERRNREYNRRLHQLIRSTWARRAQISLQTTGLGSQSAPAA